MQFAHHSQSAPANERVLNVHPMVARLVIGKKATFHELKTIYSLSDIYDLNEILNLEEEKIFLQRKKDADN